MIPKITYNTTIIHYKEHSGVVRLDTHIPNFFWYDWKISIVPIYMILTVTMSQQFITKRHSRDCRYIYLQSTPTNLTKSNYICRGNLPRYFCEGSKRLRQHVSDVTSGKMAARLFDVRVMKCATSPVSWLSGCQDTGTDKTTSVCACPELWYLLAHILVCNNVGHVGITRLV